MKTTLTRKSLIALIISFAIIAGQTPASACTRALYVAKDGTILTGRSMDWGEDLHSNMWVLPRGMKRDGMGGKNSIQWESKYGSLVVSAYDIGSSDGMNEKGLVVNMLALVESDYGKPAEGGKVICMSTWLRYVLTITPPSRRPWRICAKRSFACRPSCCPPVAPPTCTSQCRTPLGTRPSSIT